MVPRPCGQRPTAALEALVPEVEQEEAQELCGLRVGRPQVVPQVRRIKGEEHEGHTGRTAVAVEAGYLVEGVGNGRGQQQKEESEEEDAVGRVPGRQGAGYGVFDQQGYGVEQSVHDTVFGVPAPILRVAHEELAALP